MVMKEIQIKINDLDELLSKLPISIRNHSRRVAVCSAIIADYARTFINTYDIPSGASLPVIAHLGGTCHDIGKLLLSDADNNGSDYLLHPVAGADFLEKHKKKLLGKDPSSQMIIDIVRYHHEQFDGSGFPKGLKYGEKPFTAEICSIADKLDHFVFPDNQAAGDYDEAHKKLKAQADKSFCESAWVCTERAWPYLIEIYDQWK